MAKVVKIECGKCAGRGTISAFNHVECGRCFSCKGRGHFVTTKRAQEKKAQAAARRREESQRAVDAAGATHDRLIAKYENDSRIGPETKERCERSDVFRFQVLSYLNKWDTVSGWIQSKPWIAQALAK